MSLFNFSKRKIQGYVYASKDEHELFGNAKVGGSAFKVDEEGEICLLPIWANAVEKILHAGMSYASDNILSESERETLRTPFNEVFGLN